MFNLQPGTGLGFTGSKQIALGLGGFADIVIPPVIPPAPGPGPSGRGSGPTTGVQLPPFRDYKDWEIEETRRKRILIEDDDLVALIMAMVTRDML